MYQPGMGVVDIYTHAASPDTSMGNMVFPPKELLKSFVLIFLFSWKTSFLYPQCFIDVSLFKDAGVIEKYSLATLLRKKTSLKKNVKLSLFPLPSLTSPGEFLLGYFLGNAVYHNSLAFLHTIFLK